MKSLERGLGILLILGAGGHLLGSIAAYRNSPITLLWAVAASVLVALLGVLNLLRINRPADRSLAWVVAAGCASWTAIAIGLGLVIHDVTNPRVVANVVLALAVTGTAVRSRRPGLSPARGER